MRNHEPEPPIKARFLTHRYCEIINVCPCTWTEAQGYFFMWQEVTNTLSCSINHLHIHKMGRQFHRLGVKPEDCAPVMEWVRGWIHALCSGVHLLHLSFGFLTCTMKTETALTLRGCSGDSARTKKKCLVNCNVGQESRLCGCHFSSSFLLFLFLLASQINSSFRWSSNEVYYKKPNLKILLGEIDKGQKVGPWRVQLCTKYQHDWGIRGKHSKSEHTHGHCPGSCEHLW